MDLPELVSDHLDGESPIATVDLGGEDRVVVTPTRTLLYRAEGLLSDESVESFAHDVERLELRSGRRKTTFRLGYVDGVQDFSVPRRAANEVLVPLLAGVLRDAGIVEAGEEVRGAYRFSELTLVVTDRRVLKHVGGDVWDAEYDDAPFADLTGLAFEEGSVATEMAVEVGGYPQRFKVPNEHAGTVRKTLQNAVFEFHGVSSLDELEAAVGTEETEEADILERSGFTRLLDPDEDDEAEGEEGHGADEPAASGAEGDTDARSTATGTADAGDAGDDVVAGTGSEPQDATPDPDSGYATDSVGGTDADAEHGGTGEADTRDEALAERLDELTERVERQHELLERQQATIEQLVEELRRGR